MNVKVVGNVLTVNSHIVELPCAIHADFVENKVLLIGEKIIVCMFPGSEEFIAENKKLPNWNKNVWCFDLQGKKLWEIEEQKKFFHMDKNREFISLRANGNRVIAYNSVGFNFEVDLNTGAISLFPPDQSRPW